MNRLAFLSVLMLFTLSSCGPGQLRVSMTDGLPPRFTFEGPGRWAECCNTFFEFAVMERTQDDPNPWDSHANITDNPHLIWRVVPPEGSVLITDAPAITYGVVPKGWTQTHPQVGSPPALIEGRTYVAGQPHKSSEGTLLFLVQGGKAVVAKKPTHQALAADPFERALTIANHKSKIANQKSKITL